MACDLRPPASGLNSDSLAAPASDDGAAALPADLLWTGGWDSTFRLLQLLFEERRPVRPHYIIDTGRRSTLCELRAMASIRRRLFSQHPHTKPLLKRTLITEMSGIAEAPAITEAYNRLLNRCVLGSQYEWLARYAAQSVPRGLELAIEKGGRADALLGPFVSSFDDGGRKTCRVDQRFSGTDEHTLFQYFSFPILHLEKRDMERLFAPWAVGDILDLTWFCFHPTAAGRPCGVCNPCVLTIQEGLARRVPLGSRIRHHLSLSWRLRQLLARYPRCYSLARTIRRQGLTALLRPSRSQGRQA